MPPKAPTRIGRAVATLEEVIDDLNHAIVTRQHQHPAQG
jgi:hypothetical protein